MLIKKIGNRGFGLREFIACLVLVLIVIVVIFKTFFNSNSAMPIKNFRNHAKTFVINATSLRDSDPRFANVVYLKDAVDNAFMEHVPNPWNKSEYCDETESKLVSNHNKRFVTFKCGNYLIYNQNAEKDASEYVVYKVSAWKNEKLVGSNVQIENFYNVEVNGKPLYDQYYNEKEFLMKYSSSFGYTAATSLIKSEHKLLIQPKYRTMEEVE